MASLQRSSSSGVGRLLKHIGVAALFAAREVGRGSLAAQVAVNALLINVKLSGHALTLRLDSVCALPRFLKRLLVKRVGGAMVPDKRFVKVFYFEKNQSI